MLSPVDAAPLYQIVEGIDAVTIMIKVVGRMAAALRETFKQLKELKEVAF